MRLTVIDVDVSDGVLVKAGVVVILKEVVVGSDDEKSMVDVVLFSGQ